MPLTPRQLLGLALALTLTASACDQCQQIADPNRGNVDRVTDVVLFEGKDGHSYAVSANPELQHLRVLDLTDGRFLTGPNRYFPLSVPVGTETQRLAAATDAETQSPDPLRIYAVDAADDIVTIIDATTFSALGTIPTGRAPADVAALRIASNETLVAVTVPDAGVVEVTRVANGGTPGEIVEITLPEGALPLEIVSDPLGVSLVVSDGALPQIHILELVDGALQYERSVDVGGPTSGLAVGVVDVGDGLAPVVLALRTDRPAAMAVRLFRPGFPEDRYALLGGVALDTLGITAFVPDARATGATPTVCCRGLDDDSVAAGEATSAYAAVGLADGQITYLALAADHVDGQVLPDNRRVVRLIDDNAKGPGAGEGIDFNSTEVLWVPAEGGDAFRPLVALNRVDNFGSPPFVDVGTTASFLLVWEGDLTGARRLRGTLATATGAFTATVDLGGRDLRVGDIARIEADDPKTGCEDDIFRARITAVDGATATFALDGAETPSISSGDLTRCLDGAGQLRLTGEAQDAFVVTRDDRSLGRLRFAADVASGDDDGAIALAGLNITINPSPNGRPLPGSRLALPVEPNLQTMGLASLGTVSLIPTGLVGGTIVIPDAGSDEAGASFRTSA